MEDEFPTQRLERIYCEKLLGGGKCLLAVYWPIIFAPSLLANNILASGDMTGWLAKVNKFTTICIMTFKMQQELIRVVFWDVVQMIESLKIIKGFGMTCCTMRLCTAEGSLK